METQPLITFGQLDEITTLMQYLGVEPQDLMPALYQRFNINDIFTMTQAQAITIIEALKYDVPA